MSSYYKNIQGTLKTGKTARADDIHLIQSSIQNAIKEMIIDMFGSGFIIGESENALKLYGTDLHTDQSNLEYNNNACWMSFYDTYLRQPITITKSSIETIRVQMVNNTTINTTIYAEIRDVNLKLVQETNTLLKPTDEHGTDVYFNFNKHHLEVGKYYFIIRPVDISATDLALNGDEKLDKDGNPILGQVVTYDDFCVKYDVDGHYSHGLEASVDGKNYLNANIISNSLTVVKNNSDIGVIPEDKSKGDNHDLYFEEIFSSGSTYLIDDKFAAVVLGEKVYPHDTHVTLQPPSDKGNRIDLVSLTKDGELHVKEGNVYTDNEEKDIPTNPVGLKVAYITNYKASLKKVPSINQDDTNHITRNRDILERLRRVEKRLEYEATNNAPTRIKYNCTIDPILKNNDKDNEPEIRGEGSYGISTSIDEKGNIIASDETVINYAWSIIKDNYTYEIGHEETDKGQIEVWDVFSTPTQTKDYNTETKGLYRYHAEVTDRSGKEPKPIAGLELTVQIKKSGDLKHTLKVTTNRDGVANYTFFAFKLPIGTYSITTIYGNQTVSSKLTIQNTIKHVEKSHKKQVTLPKVEKQTLTNKLPAGVIPGNDSFYTENLDVDVDTGEVSIKKITNITDEYEVNEGRTLLKDTSKYESHEEIHLIKKEKEDSDFPALHVTFDREVYIKSITPYIAGFKNIESFGILIFKNDIIHNITDKRETYKKVIGSDKAKKDTYDDATFPTLYKSEYKSLKDIVKESGDYKVPKEPILFDDVNLDIEPGTYTIMICPKIESDKEEGEIKIKKYATKKDAIIYGTDEKVHGSSKLSVVYISTTDAHDTSWDIAIKHKTYRYYDSGLLISKPIDTGLNVSACIISKNFIIPKNCDILLYVSNDGSSWELAENNYVKFQNPNSSFKWKIEMKSNNIATPKLKFNPNKENAISFSLVTSASYVEYEDFNRCYESPIMNANSITRQYVTRQFTQDGASSAFTQWEFARVFMEDQEMQSKIDILISYAHNDFWTSIGTPKENWFDTIFFSTVFADLTLDDFTQESIDYDNYEGNIEYDEHNFRFSFDTNYLMHYTNGLVLASPDSSDTANGSVFYGNINPPNGTDMSKFFKYDTISIKDSPYAYYNPTNSDGTYAGLHVSEGPYVKATYRKLNNTTNNYTSDDTIIGIRFNNGLDINENITHLTIGIIPHIANTTNTKTIINEDGTTVVKNYFPSKTFKIALSLGRNGEIDKKSASAGKEYIIDKELYSDEYNEINIDFIDDFEGYEASGINSIALKAVDPSKNPLQSAVNNEQVTDSDSIGLGRITTSSYNIRPYSPYTNSSWDRLKWTKCDAVQNNPKAQAWGIVTLQNGVEEAQQLFYPIDDVQDKESTRKITSITEQLDGDTTYVNKNGNQYVMQVWQKVGTSHRKLPNQVAFSESNYIERKDNQVTTVMTNNNGQTQTHVESVYAGSETVFQCPAGVTGKLFKLDIDIPLTIYDCIQVEYYVFTQFWNTEDSNSNGKPPEANIDTTGHYNVQKHEDGNIYYTNGSFSKGEIMLDFYETRDIDNTEPIFSLALPSWGRLATSSRQKHKAIHAWFKKRTSHTQAKCVVLRRANPRQIPTDKIKSLKLVINDILFINGILNAALGPQMQLRIYPNNKYSATNTKIRKIGGVYRI